MSLYSALYAGVAGLNAQSSAMSGVADNITNINTVGYKRIQTEFSTLVTEGRANKDYSAGGVEAIGKAMVSQQGLLQASNNQTDLAIDGAGFFVVRTGPESDSGVAFSRAGSFRPDNSGYLRNTGGFYLQGWRLDSDGNYNETEGVSSLEPVKISELSGTALPTTRLKVRANLQSTASVIGAYTSGDMARGTVTPAFARNVEIYDAQGGARQLTLGFVKTGPNTWAAELFANSATDVTAVDGILTAGTVAFNPDGSLDKAGSSPALFSDLNISWTNGAGSVPVKLGLGSDGGLDGLTQFGSASALSAFNVDGGMLGNISSISVSAAGVVSAVFDNGQSRQVFKLPVASFQNPDGLTRISGNGFLQSDASGNVGINPPGVLGAGVISPGSLEASNVDLAQEFTNMIRFQRAYSASSKIITTVDDMLQEIGNLKR
ncbi:MAG: flagellar hook protein FlgE [Sandaracinobacter sp.]